MSLHRQSDNPIADYECCTLRREVNNQQLCRSVWQETVNLLNEPLLISRNAVAAVSVLRRLAIESNPIEHGRLRCADQSVYECK